jgi:hypothetical protein
MMHTDIMYVNGTPYFISFFSPLEYVMVDRITKRDEWSLWKIINGQINHVKRYKFYVPIVSLYVLTRTYGISFAHVAHVACF